MRAVIRVHPAVVAVLVGLPALACHSSPTGPNGPAAPAPPSLAAIFLTPDRWDLPPAGGSLELVVETSATATGGSVVPNVTVAVRASSGTLSADSVQTDFSGHARLTWTGKSSATVTAQSGDVVASSTIRVTASTDPNPPNPPGPPTPPAPPHEPGILNVSLFAEYGPVVAGVPVRLNGIALDGARGTPPGVRYDWDFNGDGTFERSGDDSRPFATFPTSGRYTIVLRALAPDGRVGSGQIGLDVLPGNTGFTAALTVSNDGPKANQETTFTVTISPPRPSVDPIQCVWSSSVSGVLGTTTLTDGFSTFTRGFSTSGTHVITATVTTPDGRAASASKKILVGS